MNLYWQRFLPPAAGRDRHRVLHFMSLFHRSPSSAGRSQREELVAELGSAFLCADLELQQEPREDNAAYIATWLEVLKMRTAPSLRQPPMPNEQPITSTRRPLR
jgi:antirestriction protein ArdC